MAGINMVEQVRDGMQVRAADGRRIGKVNRVYIREAEVYLQVIAKASWRIWYLLEPKYLYLPGSAVADVAGRRVTLNMDTVAARSCTDRPTWIPAFSMTPDGPGFRN